MADERNPKFDPARLDGTLLPSQALERFNRRQEAWARQHLDRHGATSADMMLGTYRPGEVIYRDPDPGRIARLIDWLLGRPPRKPIPYITRRG